MPAAHASRVTTEHEADQPTAEHLAERHSHAAHAHALQVGGLAVALLPPTVDASDPSHELKRGPRRVVGEHPIRQHRQARTLVVPRAHDLVAAPGGQARLHLVDQAVTDARGGADVDVEVVGAVPAGTTDEDEIVAEDHRPTRELVFQPGGDGVLGWDLEDPVPDNTVAAQGSVE